jgi:amino-acid N-acetyltransferase
MNKTRPDGAIVIRPATERDVSEIVALVNGFAAQNVMLPRSAEQVLAALGDFRVAVDGEQLAGCGSLIALTPALAEIRSLAVAPAFQGGGLGGLLVTDLLRLAAGRRYDQVCALTLRPAFFQRQGFEVVDRWGLTPKIWQECVFCAKFHHCDETAMLFNLVEPAVAAGVNPSSQAGREPVFRLIPVTS